MTKTNEVLWEKLQPFPWFLSDEDKCHVRDAIMHFRMPIECLMKTNVMLDTMEVTWCPPCLWCTLEGDMVLKKYEKAHLFSNIHW